MTFVVHVALLGMSLAPLSLIQDKAAQVVALRPHAPAPGLATATMALG